jgi:hypothetical protein
MSMSRSVPPQRAQASISMPNTRFSRCAQLIATCRGGGGSAGSTRGCFAASRPRRAGATAARSRLWGANNAVIPRQVT